MKIGIIGAGMIGGTLARRLTALGHEVAITNSRGPETLRDLAAETGARAVTAAEAARSGAAPESVAYDWLMEGGGRHFLYTPVRNYVEASPAVLREMLRSELAVIGLADGGAHCAVLSDASMPTFVLTHWRERPGAEGFALEWLVHRLTQRPAQAWGFTDRGVIAAGRRADLNLIDIERLALRMPAWERDLPGGAGRLVQRAEGYVATLVSGVATVRRGEPTGMLPGRLCP